MKHIGNLSYAEGAKHKKKRIGRGPGSGHGGTSTRGHKGAQYRRGHTTNPAFEGGQMPLNRRLPKFGFNNRFRKEYQVINVGMLQALVDEIEFEGNNINFEILLEKGILSKKNMPLKILGEGELKTAINVVAHQFSKTAKEKIESSGGTVTIHE